MIDAHEVVDYLKDHFNQSDDQIVLILSQGALLMQDCQQAIVKTGYAIPVFDDNLLHTIDKICDYLSDVIEGELNDGL